MRKFIVAMLLACVCGTHAAQGPVYKLLYSPGTGAAIGYLFTMFEVRPDLFYVLSLFDSNSFGGTIFTVTSTGTFKSIYSFAPFSSLATLIQGADGKLYGSGHVTGTGGYSFYYSIRPSGKKPQMYPPPRGWEEGYESIVAPPGLLYDILATPASSPTYAFATISETGKITILHQLSTSEGVPSGFNLVYGADGNVYSIGTQGSIGETPAFIFRFTPAGAYSQLLTFPQPLPSTYHPPLIAASDGDLYGLFIGGGPNGTGQIYRATLSGKFRALANFPAQGMSQPQWLVQASDGNIYGTTNRNQIFRYELTTGKLSQVYQLDPIGSQGKCPCQLIEGMDGKLYGVANVGGAIGTGAVFSLDIGLAKPTPAISGLYPASGPVGQKVLLWGRFLLGATSVTFNGAAAASVTVTSVQSVQVTVPAGATTGPVTITTANGSFTSTQNFTVQ